MKVTENKDKTYQWNEVKQKQRDNYHIILLAKNYEGVKEINSLVSMANDDNHMYYKPRISFEEASKISDNVIMVSACFLQDTDVETNNGHTPIQNVQSGVKVLTHDNTYQEVIIPTTREYHGDIYNIHTTGGALDVKCTSNHKFLCINKNDVEHNYTSFDKTYELDAGKYIPTTRQKISKAFRNYQPEWIEADRLTKNMYMLTPIYTHVDETNTIDIEFANIPIKGGHPHHKLKSYCIDYSPMLFELFGLYAAEGSMNRHTQSQVVFSLSGSEEHLALKIIDYTEKLFGIHGTYRFKTDSYGIDVYLSSVELYKVFEHYFLHGASNKNIPQFIKDAPPDLQMYFIKGLFLGDGHSRKNISRVTFATISKELFYDTVQILYRNSINPCCLKIAAHTGKDGVRHQDSYYIDINGHLGKYISDFIWKDCDFDSKSLEYRYQKDIPFIWNGVWYMKQSITNISYSYQDTQVYCLNVNNNHSFIANGLIAHNCLASPLWSWKRTVMDYKAEVESIKAEILQWQSNKEKFIAELNGETTVRKKKRKPELIEADIQKCDDYLHNLIINIKNISSDMEDIAFNINDKEKWFTKLFYRYDYLEVQPHVNSNDQKEFNKWLLNMSKAYHKPIVCGTDTHSFDSYAAECRTIMQIAKGIEFLEEDTFDLTLKTYDELIQMFREQGVLSEEEIEIALNNTNVIADSVEDFELDKSFKYPIFDTPENDAKTFEQKCWEGLEEKIKCGAIDINKKQEYIDRINEELRVMNKLKMCGFMLSMHYLVGQLRAEGIPFGFGRGSNGGCLTSYLTDISDIDALLWDLSFERFCNENRVSLPDIDIDCSDLDEPYILQCMSNTVGEYKVAHVFALGTNQSLGAIDDIGRALARKWINDNGKDTKELKIKKRQLQHSALSKEERKAQIDGINEQIKAIDKYNDKLDNPYSLKRIAQIKKEFGTDEQQCREKHQDIFYYFDGIVDVKISASIHPAGNICSDRTLDDNYGIMINDGKRVIQLDMDAAHEVNLVKYDILKLKSVKVLKKICDYLHQPYPRSYEVDWHDKDVWDDITQDNLAIPQFESTFSGQLIHTMHPNNVEELAMINAAIRPAGASYREALVHRQPHHSKNPEVDKFLSSTLSFLIFQENIMQFLQKFCGFSGSASDDIRRAVGAKDKAVIEETIPKIIDAYCEHRDLPRKQAEEEAQEYVQVIRDASSYAFNKSHAVAYSMLGYMFAYMKHYHPAEFICAFLNYADNDDDVTNGTKLALERGYKIEEPTFRHGRSEYSFDNDKRIIYKGMSSIKYMNEKASEQLFLIGKQQYDNFFEVLRSIKNKTSVNSRQLDLLIKLNFFKEFGNIKKLMKYVELFDMFKQGDISIINREKINSDTIWKIVARIAEIDNDVEKVNIKKTKANGCVEIFKELSELLDCMDIKEFSFKDRIAWQKEFLGYINLTTGLDEDRKKLFITSMRPIIAKKGRSAGKAWCRIITTHSLGRGIDGEWWVLEGTYQKYYRFNEGDIIIAGKVRPEKYQDKKQWWLDSYELCID